MEDNPEKGILAFIKSLLTKQAPISKSSDLAEEINELMDEGQAKGLISNEESHMVHGVLELKITDAHSIMIPRTEISADSLDTTLDEIIKLINDCGHTRIPIYDKNIDQIVGILHSKDLLKLRGKQLDTKIQREILRKPYFVPETQKISEILRYFKKKKTHMAIVTDEYGGTSGIITIEDIIEEIVGDIMDEHDNDEQLLTVLDNDALLVDARLEVEKLEKQLDIELSTGEFESVGGFIIHLLGRIPEVNEKITYENLEIIINKGDQRKIDQVLIKRAPST